MTFRDYKKALPTTLATHIPVNFVENNEDLIEILDGISFISFKVYSKLFSKETYGENENLIVIADEFD